VALMKCSSGCCPSGNCATAASASAHCVPGKALRDGNAGGTWGALWQAANSAAAASRPIRFN